jgi:hypothetical protein
MAEREIRLQIMISGDELEAVETWRFKTRMPSRAAAIRELLRRGLIAEGFELAQAGQRSADFGITKGPKRESKIKSLNK